MYVNWVLLFAATGNDVGVSGFQEARISTTDQHLRRHHVFRSMRKRITRALNSGKKCHTLGRSILQPNPITAASGEGPAGSLVCESVGEVTQTGKKSSWISGWLGSFLAREGAFAQ